MFQGDSSKRLFTAFWSGWRACAPKRHFVFENARAQQKSPKNFR
jgi:hypothetical protein